MAKDCRLLVEANGKSVQCHGPIVVEESVHGTAVAQLSVEGDEDPELDFGQEVKVTIELGGDEKKQGSIALYCARVTTRGEGPISSIGILAADPIAFCDAQSAFVTRLGNRDIGALAQEVVSECFDGSPPPVGNGDSAIQAPWLLQAGESSKEFLERIARQCGCTVFWNRDSLDLRPIERQGLGTDHQFSRGTDYWSIEHSRTPPWRARRAHWVDPESRSLHVLNVDRDGSTGSPRLTDRITARMDPSVASYLGGGHRSFGESWMLQCFRPDVRLGDTLAWSTDQAPVVVTSIVHTIEPGGRYENWLTAVPFESWGAGPRPAAASGRLGLLQAEVVDNDDPARQHRIRVILSEDPERRASPWIPVVSLAAGADSGAFWLPEVGDLVLLHVDPITPELLSCVGSIRGESQKGQQAWRSSSNAKKALFLASGVGITFDEESKSLRLETPEAAIELCGKKITMSGDEIDIRVDSGLKAKAGGKVEIDGSAINLG